MKIWFRGAIFGFWQLLGINFVQILSNLGDHRRSFGLVVVKNPKINIHAGLEALSTDRIHNIITLLRVMSRFGNDTLHRRAPAKKIFIFGGRVVTFTLAFAVELPGGGRRDVDIVHLTRKVRGGGFGGRDGRMFLGMIEIVFAFCIFELIWVQRVMNNALTAEVVVRVLRAALHTIPNSMLVFPFTVRRLFTLCRK